jgi:transcriptional regulator with GAF, ATPase, and Fis domain
MTQPTMLSFLAEIPELMVGSISFKDFADRSAESFRRFFHATHVSYWVNIEGNWQLFSSTGRRDLVPPVDELSQAQDTEQVLQSPPWIIMPVGGRDSRQVFAIHLENRKEPSSHWELMRRGMNSAVQSVIQKEREARLKQLLRSIRRNASSGARTPGAYAQEVEESLKQIYGAIQCALYIWQPRKQELILPGKSTTRLPIDVVARGRQAIRSRHPDLAILEPANANAPDAAYRILTLPVATEDGIPLAVVELVFRKPQPRDPLVDEGELSDLSQMVADAVRNFRGKDYAEAGTGEVPKPPTDSQYPDMKGDALLGESEAIRKVKDRIARVAPTNLCVLILGENGTGKEVVSRMIHDASPRRHEIFLAVNCAAMSETLLESELFGHEKGAFTDANETRPGKFETASQGTLLLDEVGELSLRAQAKLLRVLEEKSVVRVGGEQVIPTDVRILAATNRNLLAMVREKTFREDLYFRLNVVAIQLPPLRERGEDIILLTKYFLAEHARLVGRDPLGLTPSAEEALRAHSWPGNVRELRNLTERLTFLHPRPLIDGKDLRFSQDTSNEAYGIDAGLDLSEATRAFQISFIRRHIALANNNVTEAARLLGMHRTNLYRKMSQLKMTEVELPHASEDIPD